MKPTFWNMMKWELGYLLERITWTRRFVLRYSHLSPNGKPVFKNIVNSHMVILEREDWNG